MGVAPKTGLVRRFGWVLVPLILAESALGVASAAIGNSGAPPLLVAHVVLGIVVVGVAAWTLWAAGGSRNRWARVAVWWTAFAIFATAATGALFLETAFAQGATVDRVLALLDLAGAVLMVIWGSAERDPTSSQKAADLR